MLGINTLDDAKTIAGPLIRLFKAGLGRPPDDNALRTFLPMMRRDPSGREVAQAIAASPEFCARHGTDEADRSYIAALFRDGCRREPKPAEISFHLAAAVGGMTRADLLLGVAQSAEAEARIDIGAVLFSEGLPPQSTLAYQLWLDRPQPDAPDAGQDAAAPWQDGPLMSLVVVAPHIRPDLLWETVEAVQRQLYPAWELCLVRPDDLPPAAAAVAEAAGKLPGVRVVAWAGGMPALQAGLAAASGSFVGFLAAGDRLEADALHHFAASLQEAPDAVLLYSDEDAGDAGGQRWAPCFKPSGWSPDLLLAGDAVGQLAVLRRDRALAVGGIRASAAPFERYDLVLRAVEGVPSSQLRHIPTVLFHRSRAPGLPAPFPAARAIAAQPVLRDLVARHIAESAQAVALADATLPCGVWPRLRFLLPEPAPLVSVIIPTRDRPELLRRCLDGLLQHTDYPAIEILVVDNGGRTPGSAQLMRHLAIEGRVRLLAADMEFNWSALNNLAVREANGAVVVLLNDDIEVIDPGWLRELVSHALRPDVGAVGARLLFPTEDRSVQHGGVMFNSVGEVTHVMAFAGVERAGYLGQAALTRDLSAVTGACLATRRAVFDAVGGLTEAGLSVGWGDIDFCLRVRAGGWRVVWTPHATLLHHEAATRGHDVTPDRLARLLAEASLVRRRWGEALTADPFRNPNLQAPGYGDLKLAGAPYRPQQSQDVQRG